MPWRVIAHDNQVWHVDAVAERPAHTQAWQLALSFRAAGDRPAAGPSQRPKSFWMLYPLEATSKSALFLQAAHIPDAALARLLQEQVI